LTRALLATLTAALVVATAAGFALAVVLFAQVLSAVSEGARP
jgi:hypothetical protein